MDHKTLEEPRFEEYFCQPNVEINDRLRASKFLHLRTLTFPNDTGVPMEDLYSKAVSRLVQNLPNVKFVSLSGSYEYSADDMTDGMELKAELLQIKHWMHTITAEFFKHQIQVMEFELFASFGFDDSISLKQLVNETFGHDYNLDLSFCSLSFSCDVTLPLDYGSGEFLLSSELTDHVSRGPSGRKTSPPLSCELYKHEENSAVHQFQFYELNSETLNLSDYQSKQSFHLDLKVEHSQRKEIKRLYEEGVKNFKRNMSNVEKVKLRAQTYFEPVNSTSEAELKMELRYLKRWAQVVADAFLKEGIQIQSFNLMATFGFDHTIPLIDVFESAFNQHKTDDDDVSDINSYLTHHLYSAQIPLQNTKTQLQAEILLNGGLQNRKNGRHSNKTNFLTLRQLLATSQ